MLEEGSNTLKSNLSLRFSMHEWALAEAIIDASSQIAEKEGLIEISEVIINWASCKQIEKDIPQVCSSTSSGLKSSGRLG